MPLLHRTHPPIRSAAAVQAAPMNRAWPVSIALIVLIVFTVFLAQTTLLIALAVALTTTVAGAVLLTLMFGTTWIIRLPGRLSRRR